MVPRKNRKNEAIEKNLKKSLIKLTDKGKEENEKLDAVRNITTQQILFNEKNELNETIKINLENDFRKNQKINCEICNLFLFSKLRKSRARRRLNCYTLIKEKVKKKKLEALS